MSYDLAIWNEVHPITAREAAERYACLCEGEPALFPTERIEALYADLVERYPELSALSGEEKDRSPWVCAIDRSGGHLLLTLCWDRVDEVEAILASLCRVHDLVLFDPQSNELTLPPSLARAPRLRICLEDGTEIDQPDPEQLRRCLGLLHPERNAFAILQRTDLDYIQTAVDDQGRFVLEYQQDSVERHFRCEGLHLGRVLEVFQDYASGQDGWIKRFQWSRLDLTGTSRH